MKKAKSEVVPQQQTQEKIKKQNTDNAKDKKEGAPSISTASTAQLGAKQMGQKNNQVMYSDRKPSILE